jgi:thiol:disulfide interchange protein
MGDRVRNGRSRLFLLLVAAVFIPVFALPLLIDPIWWAERFGWDTAGAGDLTNYLGRCLGAVALAIAIVALRAARDPAAHRWLFDLLALAAALLALVHLRGTLEDSQPAIEHAETLMYGAFAAAALLCKPPPGASAKREMAA